MSGTLHAKAAGTTEVMIPRKVLYHKLPGLPYDADGASWEIGVTAVTAIKGMIRVKMLVTAGCKSRTGPGGHGVMRLTAIRPAL